MAESTPYRTPKELTERLRGNRGLTTVHLIAQRCFKYRKQADDFVYSVIGQPERAVSLVTNVLNASDPRPVVLERALAYGRTSGIPVWHYRNDAVCRPIFKEILKRQFVPDIKTQNPKLYQDLYNYVCEYMWQSKPLRACFEMPDEVGRIAGSVFNRKIKIRLTDEEKRRYLIWQTSKTDGYERSITTPAQLGAFIIELLSAHPLDSYNAYDISNCTDVTPDFVQARLEILARNSSGIIPVKNGKYKRIAYKWCPEAGRTNKVERYCKSICVLLKKYPGASLTEVRAMVRRYFGRAENEITDRALKLLEEAKLIKVEKTPGKSNHTALSQTRPAVNRLMAAIQSLANPAENDD